MSHLVVETIGPQASLQDRGRQGWQRFGVGTAGAMDQFSAALANALVGNGAELATIELMLAGGSFRLEGGDALIALIGAGNRLTIAGREIAPGASAIAHDGDRIVVGPARGGVYGCLAVAGGLDVPPTLGSVSLHARTGVGGHVAGNTGRRIEAGDLLVLRRSHIDSEPRELPAIPERDSGPVRVILGPQDDYFSAKGLATLLGEPYRISARIDRMGLRLEGPTIEHGPKGYNIVSDGIATGSIQVPGAGEPIILLRDRQTTGGYPKIATVITADLDRLAQLPPGSEVRFTRIDRAEAVTLAHARAALLAETVAAIGPSGAASLDAARLLSLNLIDGWLSAEP